MQSGALAELIVVDKIALTKAPQGDISIEQIAALPLSGVPAFYAVSTLAADLPKEARVRVLRFHTSFSCSYYFSIGSC